MLKYFIPLVLFWSFSSKSISDGYVYVPKSLTKQQQIHQGLIPVPKYTTCRLKKRVKTKSGKQVCVYIGGNKTYEMMVENSCPRKYKCLYNPNQKEPNIDDVINSLNKAVK